MCCAIGSATSLNESSSCSKISKSGSSFDSNQSVAGSNWTGGERDADFTMRNRGGGGESDVEILSNPSQSSIEVLEYSSRKHSIDRRVSQQPSLDTIDDDASRLQLLASIVTHHHHQPDDLTAMKSRNGSDDDSSRRQPMATTVLNNVHLTESSSSGSVTDSICTAYEQNVSTDSKSAAQVTTPTTTKQLNKSDSVISNMFGGKFRFFLTIPEICQKRR